MTKSDKRLYGLFMMIEALAPIYNSLEDEYIKSQFETTIGANIFYQDTSSKLFSGLISEGTNPGQAVKEHKYPRKLAAKQILSNPPGTFDELKALYYTEYGVYNLVTKRENMHLRKFQKDGVFTTPEEAYEKAGIKLVPLKNANTGK